MFNYNINWEKQVKENVPMHLQKVRRLEWIHSLLKPLKAIHDELLLAREDSIYKVAYTSQVIYLEKILNDKFDNVNRGIYIADTTLFNSNYIYKKIESKPAVYLYRKWNAATAYILGDRVEYNDKIYECINPNTNSDPYSNPSDWNYYRDLMYVRMGVEYGTSGFIVMVPSTVVFDINRMKALINYYRFASKHYTIQTY